MVSDKFLVNSDMFGIKKYVLKLGNWMVTLKQWLEPNQNQTKQNQNQKYSRNHGSGQILGQFWHVWYQKACTQAGKLNGDLKTMIGAKPKQNQAKPKPKI